MKSKSMFGNVDVHKRVNKKHDYKNMHIRKDIVSHIMNMINT